MKRTVCIIVILALLMSGCAFGDGQAGNTAEFYYLRTCRTEDDYQLYFTEGAIAPERRDISGHRSDLTYLLILYLRGPLDSQLESPFPGGCSLIDVHREGNELTVSLSSGASLLDDLDLTVACACLARTCMALAEVDTVHIQSLSIVNEVLFSTTITSDNLLLGVTPPPASAPAEETQSEEN